MSPELKKEIDLAGGIALKRWCQIVGISVRTTQRWRKDPAKGFEVVWRYGIPFLSAETVRKFFVDDGSAPDAPKLGKPKG